MTRTQNRRASCRESQLARPTSGLVRRRLVAVPARYVADPPPPPVDPDPPCPGPGLGRGGGVNGRGAGAGGGATGRGGGAGGAIGRGAPMPDPGMPPPDGGAEGLRPIMPPDIALPPMPIPGLAALGAGGAAFFGAAFRLGAALRFAAGRRFFAALRADARRAPRRFAARLGARLRAAERFRAPFLDPRRFVDRFVFRDDLRLAMTGTPREYGITTASKIRQPTQLGKDARVDYFFQAPF